MEHLCFLAVRVRCYE